MKKLLFLNLILINSLQIQCQEKTDFSLFLRSDSTHYLETVSSESGDLFQQAGHHGPAIENEWFGLRIYFDQKCAIDVYSKARPGLELKEARWYPTAEQQAEGWGADYYKVGTTVGLGGVRLWDGNQVVNLNPVTRRTAKVFSEGGASSMEMISEGVPYKDDKVDILVRVTVKPGTRYAIVEARTLNRKPVQFVTGINYHVGHRIEEQDGWIATWGIHPEDVAAEQVEIGGAIRFHPDKFESKIDDGSQILLISKPMKELNTKIVSACSREPGLNNMDRFVEFLSH